jgi:hypothetical protein
MVIFRRIVVTSLLLLGACGVGEVPIGGGMTDSGAGGNPAAAFTAHVTPQVTRCTGCHGGGTGPTLTGYANLEAKYKTKAGAMILLTKAADGGQHEGITYFSATEKAEVTMFVNALP